MVKLQHYRVRESMIMIVIVSVGDLLYPAGLEVLWPRRLSSLHVAEVERRMEAGIVYFATPGKSEYLIICNYSSVCLLIT